MKIRCVVACHGGSGPELCRCIVKCTKAQYDEGDHYEAAKELFLGDGYDDPCVVFDENDAHCGLCDDNDDNNWDAVMTVDITKSE